MKSAPELPDYGPRTVAASHYHRKIDPDPDHEMGLAERLRNAFGPDGMQALLDRFTGGSSVFDAIMRRVIWRGLLKQLGMGAEIGRWVTIQHPETFAIGDGVFIGDQVVLQGRHDGTCRIGDRVWIGPQSFLDARDLEIGDAVGWGPGARVIGSEHSGIPFDHPVIGTDLEVRPVRIGRGSDIGAGTVLLPGVTIGEGCVVGAGAVVTVDLPPRVVAAGVPARVIRSRSESSESKIHA